MLRNPKMLEAMVNAARSLNASDNTDNEYARGQAELIVDACGLTMDEHRDMVLLVITHQISPESFHRFVRGPAWLTESDAEILAAIIGAARRNAIVAMVDDNPTPITGEARYIGGQYTAERDFAAEAQSDIRDLWLVIRVTSPRGDYMDIPHKMRDIMSMCRDGKFIIDYQPV